MGQREEVKKVFKINVTIEEELLEYDDVDTNIDTDMANTGNDNNEISVKKVLTMEDFLDRQSSSEHVNACLIYNVWV
ncbi:hypothetical protein SARC_01931 [Sphaeroforma arctica JP610]|uniref:Uncharacterized protein n=1 Tax=Sphaeroforma arctica JP610 TaxID=667725 RepID=A0A0L0GC99_9EUKA|nr:hypothetical protein SARC_01931 [Sphaeroforma arctica JP610]KNC85893.1 hypothetical protein SARC_01931 [Sphaeroforma arctica JP610]|eukprot:XP_014159795.1 hypothetical protein SARC_01931 [Sphaeroforma arctica JP610]